MTPTHTSRRPNSSTFASNHNVDNSIKQVRFSEYSSLHIYGVDLSYRHYKSYSSSDYQTFRTHAAFEAYRLRQLLASCPFQNAETIRLLINRGIVTREDFLGIEHLVSESAHKKVVKERRLHSASLLRRQKELRENNELDASSLAEVDIARSAQSAVRARVRAAVAA